MREYLNRIICLGILLLSLPTLCRAQVFSEPAVDGSISAGADEAKLIIRSNSDEMSMSNNYGIENVKKTANTDGTFDYTLTVPFTEDDEDDFKKMQVTVRLSSGEEETFPVTLYKGKAYTGSFMQRIYLVSKKNENQVLPEERRARVTFITKLEKFSVSCDGVPLFADGNALQIKNKNITLSTQPDGEMTKYQITFSLADATVNRNPVFRINAKDAKEIEQRLESELSYKQSVFYTVIGTTVGGTTYEELLEKAKEYSAGYATQHESTYFLAASDAYEAVRTHIECPVELKDIFQIEQNKFLFLRKYSRYVEQADERWQKAKNSEGFESANVWKYLNLGREMCHDIIKKYPEMSWFKQKYDEFDELFKQHPQSNVSFPVVSGKVSKGNGWFLPVDGTAIYAINFNCTGLDDIKGYKPIGHVQNGTYKIVLREKCSFLYFAGEKSSRFIDYKSQTLNVVLTR